MPGGRRQQVQQKPKDTKATMKRIIRYLEIYKVRLVLVFIQISIFTITRCPASGLLFILGTIETKIKILIVFLNPNFR